MSEFIRLQANGADAYPDASTENTYRPNGTSVENALVNLESNVTTLGGVAGEAKTLAEQNSVKIATAEQEISAINSSLSDIKYMLLDNKTDLVYNGFIAIIRLNSSLITSEQEGWVTVATLPEGIRPNYAFFATAYTNDAKTFNVSYALPVRLTVDGIISVYLYADKLSARPSGQLVFFYR